MHTPASLLAVHERTHRSLRDLLDHCAGLEGDGFVREMEGFAYPSIRLQLHHMIGAEQYWIEVLQGRIRVEEEDGYPDLPAIAAYREEVARATRDYLGRTGAGELNRTVTRTTWGGKERELVPACVVLRTQTHHYTHLGQVLAMLRRLDRPARGLDFALT